MPGKNLFAICSMFFLSFYYILPWVKAWLFNISKICLSPGVCPWGFHEHAHGAFISPLCAWKLHEHAHGALMRTCAWGLHAHDHLRKICIPTNTWALHFMQPLYFTTLSVLVHRLCLAHLYWKLVLYTLCLDLLYNCTVILFSSLCTHFASPSSNAVQI